MGKFMQKFKPENTTTLGNGNKKKRCNKLVTREHYTSAAHTCVCYQYIPSSSVIARQRSESKETQK